MKETTKHSYLGYSKILAWEFCFYQYFSFLFLTLNFPRFSKWWDFCEFSRDDDDVHFWKIFRRTHTKHVDYLIFFKFTLQTQSKFLFYFCFFFIHFSNKFFVVKFFSFSFYFFVCLLYRHANSIFSHLR